MPVIQYLGRWGSAAVERYVAEALARRAAWAPLPAATDFDIAEVVGNERADGTPGLGAIAGVVAKLFKGEVAKTQQKRRASPRCRTARTTCTASATWRRRQQVAPPRGSS